MSIFTNCGQYLPGQQPIDPRIVVKPPITSWSPTDLIKPRRKLPRIITQRPVPEPDIKWVCRLIRVELCPPPFLTTVFRRVRECQPCDGAPGNLAIDDPSCVHENESVCNLVCQSEQNICPEPPSYKCISYDRLFCPYPNSLIVQRELRQCRPCDGAIGPNGSINPLPGEPGCVPSLKQCQQQCSDIYNECPDQGSPGGGSNPATTGARVPPPRGGGGGGGGGGTSGTGGFPETLYSCVTTFRGDCPPGFRPNPEVPAGTAPLILQECRPCIRQGNGWIPNPPPGIPQTTGGICQSLENCRNEREQSVPGGPVPPPLRCRDRNNCIPDNTNVILANLEPRPSGGGGGGGGGGSTTTVQLEPRSQVINVELNNFNSNQINFNNQNNSYNFNTSQQYNKLITGLTNNKNKVIIDIRKEVNKDNTVFSPVTGQSKTTYDKKLNFYDAPQHLISNTTLVPNIYYRNIFSDYVSEEISYIIQRSNTNLPWDEVKLQSLTLQKIGVSINPKLFSSFNSIHDISGKKIDIDFFLNALLKHILEGTLNSFDPNFYIDLSERQKNDTIKEYKNNEYSDIIDRYALSLINNNEVSLNLENKDQFVANKLKRAKRLNEDVNATVCITRLCDEDEDISLDNTGLNLSKFIDPGVDSTLEDARLDNGDGYGYYLYLNTVKEGCKPLEYESDASAATYVPQDIRYESLNLLGESSDATLTITSLSGVHEFASGTVSELEPSALIVPMYFKLEVSSIQSSSTNNVLVEKVIATFIRLTDQSEIDSHTDTHGFTVNTVNVDYKDPILKYIMDNGQFTFSFNDVNFRKTGNNRSFTKGSVITRNIPFGIVIVPGGGSKINPLNATSKITYYSPNYITRELTLMPSFSKSEAEVIEPDLEVKYLNDVGNKDFRVGIYEDIDPQAITYRFASNLDKFINTYYNKDSNTYIASEQYNYSSIGTSYMVKEIIDYLISSYPNNTQFTWYDVLRRMPITRFGQFLLDADENLIESLANGYKNNIKFINVINRPGEQIVQTLPDDDKVIIRYEDR